MYIGRGQSTVLVKKIGWMGFGTVFEFELTNAKISKLKID